MNSFEARLTWWAVLCSAEKMTMFWDSDGIILSPLRSKWYYSARCILRKCFAESFPSCTATKTAEKGCVCAVHQGNAPAHLANVTQQFVHENMKWFCMLRTHLTWLLVTYDCFQQWNALSNKNFVSHPVHILKNTYEFFIKHRLMRPNV